VPVTALLLALAAAVVHAGWNLLIAREEDTHSATAVAVVVGFLLFAPLAALDWRLDSEALPYLGASSALELAYLGLLATGYSVAAMSFVYPIARGSAPVFVAVVGALVLGDVLPLPVLGGVLLVTVGILLVRGLEDPGRPRDLALALGVGACIAGYTLVDSRGIQHASPLAYVEVLFGVVGTLYLAAVWRVRGGEAVRRAVNPATIAAGAGFVGAYALTLAALELASAASVAAVRESSVVIATALAAVVLHERVTKARAAGAVIVVAGVACVALG
jgi:drug/metabolite transporter (DMT)-like permease